MSSSRREETVRALHRARPRSRFLLWSAVAGVALTLYSWSSGGFHLGQLLSARRLANLQRFCGELIPYPMRGQPFDLALLGEWIAEQLARGADEALVTTLAVSVAAVVLAGAWALPGSFLASRRLITAEPYAASPRPPSGALHLAWRALAEIVRLALVLCRALPEYILAFLLVAFLGPVAWALVLALAIHNAGILGRLGAEVVEDARPSSAFALRRAGASRAQLALLSLYPSSFGRFLLFLLYRWETCIREATVLGMVGVLSLGYGIVQARAAARYDEMFFLIFLGAVLVWIGDLLSTALRAKLRRST